MVVGPGPIKKLTTKMARGQFDAEPLAAKTTARNARSRLTDAQPPNAAPGATIPRIRILIAPQIPAPSKRNLRSKAVANALQYAILAACRPSGFVFRRVVGPTRRYWPRSGRAVQ